MGLAKPHIVGETPVEDDLSGDENMPVERPEELRLIEALLFAAGEPLDDKTLRERLPEGVDIASAMRRLQAEYAPRGVNQITSHDGYAASAFSFKFKFCFVHILINRRFHANPRLRSRRRAVQILLAHLTYFAKSPNS